MSFERYRLAVIFTLKRWKKLYSALRIIKNVLVRLATRPIIGFLRIAFSRSSSLGPPTGSFSAYELVKAGKIEGEVILIDQGCMAEAEKSVMRISGLNQNREQPWPIFWSHHHNVRLAGVGLALVNEQKEVCIEAVYGKARLKSDPVWHSCPLSFPHYLQGAWTSVVSSWVPTSQQTNFSHWMFEALPRLALLSRLPKETRVLVPPQLLPFQLESLRWLNLEQRVRPTPERHLALEDYYFSSPPTMIVCYNPFAVDFLRGNFLQFADTKFDAPTRIYLHRPGQFRRISNEDEVVSFFRSKGWAIVDSAALSLAQQIQLFSRAEAVVGPHGAGFSNVVWCTPGCKIIELFSPAHINGCYEWVSHCVRAQYRFLICSAGKFENAVVDLSVLQSELESAGAI